MQFQRRDLGIAFIFVALTYFFVGGVFYIIFPLDKDCIQDVSTIRLMPRICKKFLKFVNDAQRDIYLKEEVPQKGILVWNDLQTFVNEDVCLLSEFSQ